MKKSNTIIDESGEPVRFEFHDPNGIIEKRAAQIVAEEMRRTNDELYENGMRRTEEYGFGKAEERQCILAKIEQMDAESWMQLHDWAMSRNLASFNSETEKGFRIALLLLKTWLNETPE